MERADFDLTEELKKLPEKPGVYLMHDKNDHIIYVGKAIVLKNRGRQYFQKSRHVSPKIERMIEQIVRAAVDCFLCDNVVACLCERLNCICNCGGTRRYCQCGYAALERGNALFKHVLRRIG